MENFLGKIYKSNMTTLTKRKIFESATLPLLTYGAQTWATTETQNLKLVRTQIAMKRSLLGIKFSDRIRNTNVRKLFGVKDCRYVIKKLKFDLRVVIVRGGEDRWKKRFWSGTQGRV